MTLESPPKLDEFKHGLEPMKQGPEQRKKLWVVIGVLGVLAVILGVINLVQISTETRVAGTGSIVGTVHDTDGQPVEASIYILGTSIKGKANSSGNFTINNVPAGTQTVAVAMDGFGFDFPAVIEPGKITELGSLQYITTIEPYK